MEESSAQNRLGSQPMQDDDLVLEFLEFVPHRVHTVPTYHFRMRHGDSGSDLGQIFVSAPIRI